MEQSPQTLRVQEGDSVSLTCSYRVSNFRGLQWYRQDPGKGPKHLFLLYSVGKGDQKGRLSVSLSQKESSLNITAPKAEDSATYLCAVEPQCSPGTCSLHQNPAAGPWHKGSRLFSSSMRYLLSTQDRFPSGPVENEVL